VLDRHYSPSHTGRLTINQVSTIHRYVIRGAQAHRKWPQTHSISTKPLSAAPDQVFRSTAYAHGRGRGGPSRKYTMKSPPPSANPRARRSPGSCTQLRARESQGCAGGRVCPRAQGARSVRSRRRQCLIMPSDKWPQSNKKPKCIAQPLRFSVSLG
jgi:hypothetical protein